MTALPTDLRAELLEAVLAEKFPKLALGAIAARFSTTVAAMQPVLAQAGYPDPAKMRKAIDQLAARRARQRRAEVAGPSVNTQEPGGRLLVVGVDHLLEDPNNLRPPIDPDAEDIVELAASIYEAGLLQPVVARLAAGQLYIVMGHRRVAAVRRLGHSVIDCIVRGAMSPEDVLAAMLIENGQRKDLDPISEARGLGQLRRLMSTPEHPCTEADLARRIGRSAVFVRSRILLLSLDAPTQERVRSGELTIGAAGDAAASATGRTGKAGVDRNWHLGPRHPLAGPARARCEDRGHVTGRRLGAIACGECWEAVIREDERTNGPDPEGDYCSRCGAFVEDLHRDGCPFTADDDDGVPLAPAFSGASA